MLETLYRRSVTASTNVAEDEVFLFSCENKCCLQGPQALCDLTEICNYSCEKMNAKFNSN